MDAEALGWSSAWAAAWDTLEALPSGCLPARISQEHRGAYRAFAGDQEWTAEVTGAFRHHHAHPEAFPAVGDWVAAEPVPGESKLRIHAVLPRRTVFLRTAAGARSETQVVAANVDTVFLVAGLDHDFNVRRLERYLTLAYESGARPIVVLNKADTTDDLLPVLQAVERVALGVPIFAVSALAGDGLAPLQAYLGPGQTVACLGSSGAGKSTLINALSGEAHMSTGTVREDDSRGRHTTTHRELVALPHGGCLIDTPGMRELQLTGSMESVDTTFSDIDVLAENCRFDDCCHESESGCAVLAAVETGALDTARLAAWRKLQRELDYAQRRQQDSFKHEERKRFRDMGKLHKRLQNEARQRKGM
ncbi:MAG: ribosome small subunit-dependent GTPase A [Candidatus Hydrogenedens sp.]|nr:ribosome small subunit-dependent GTPase A [Candidatus Hydrogenedens sp.]